MTDDNDSFCAKDAAYQAGQKALEAIADATDESYERGCLAGLDALEALSKSGAKEHAGLAGLMAVVMHAAYAAAPTEKIADELIEFSQENAIENWVKQMDAR